jgi:chemotaxis signal transduction protein
MIGISEVRGNTIPIMNTAALLGMGDKQFTEDNFIMLSDKEGKSIGFAVDKMSGNINIDNNKKNMPDGMAENSSYITGTVNTDDGIVVIVDLIKMGDMG